MDTTKPTPELEHLHLKIDTHHRPGCGQIDVDGNHGYDMRRSLAEVVAETREAGWTIDLNLSGGPGKVDILAWRVKPAAEVSPETEAG